jgi:hypothetical protein
MILKTPRNETIIWVVALLLLYLIPLTMYSTEKVIMESSDVVFHGRSATHVFVGWFIFLHLLSPFAFVFIKWALKNYSAEVSLFKFNHRRIWWSLFWSLFFGIWIYTTVECVLQIFRQFYFPEALQVITLTLITYLFLCLRVCVILKERNFKLDTVMTCIGLLINFTIHYLLFS